jgi:putative membrane protein
VSGIVFSSFGSTMMLAIIISVMNMIFVGKK